MGNLLSSTTKKEDNWRSLANVNYAKRNEAYARSRVRGVHFLTAKVVNLHHLESVFPPICSQPLESMVSTSLQIVMN